jgi:hypothetical protein
MTIKFVDIAGRREFPIPGMAGYAHFSDIILYPALPFSRTEMVNPDPYTTLRVMHNGIKLLHHQYF